jgi:hypothetical protein
MIGSTLRLIVDIAARLKTPLLFIKPVSDGYCPSIPDSVRSVYAELMKRCWSRSPNDRPDFKEIASLLGKEKFLEAVDIEAVRDYQVQVCPADGLSKLSPRGELQRMADAGDAQVQVQFGFKLKNCDGIERNAEAAVPYFRLAADQNNSNGIIALG